MYVRDDKYLMFLKIFDNSIYVLVYIYVEICVYINISIGICIFVLDICRCSINVVQMQYYYFVMSFIVYLMEIVDKSKCFINYNYQLEVGIINIDYRVVIWCEIKFFCISMKLLRDLVEIFMFILINIF